LYVIYISTEPVFFLLGFDLCPLRCVWYTWRFGTWLYCIIQVLGDNFTVRFL